VRVEDVSRDTPIHELMFVANERITTFCLKGSQASGDALRGDKVFDLTFHLDSKSSIGLGCSFFSLCVLHFMVLGKNFRDILFNALSNYCIKVDRASSDLLPNFMGRVPLFEDEI
jgi:hypothetical protein